MKNLEIVDGALNGRFEIYEVEDEIFQRLFPDGKDEIYLEDLEEVIKNDVSFWDRAYAREVERRIVRGIHGTLHTHPRAKVSIVEEAYD